MDTRLIKSIIAMFESSKVSKMELMEDTGAGKSFTIKLEKGEPVSFSQALTQPVAPQTEPAKKQEEGEGVLDFNLVAELKSPMVGVFYAAPAPDASPFVTKGSKVKKGDTLCVIEAMKLMNEITADRDGEIVEICAENGELVEFGQPLFKIF